MKPYAEQLIEDLEKPKEKNMVVEKLKKELRMAELLDKIKWS